MKSKINYILLQKFTVLINMTGGSFIAYFIKKTITMEDLI